MQNYSTLGKACFHWLLTNCLASLVVWWPIIPGIADDSYYEPDVAALLTLFIAFGSLLFIPMMLLLMHETLLIDLRWRRIRATGVALFTGYFLLNCGLVLLFALASTSPFLSAVVENARLISKGWPYLLATLVAAVIVYNRALFRPDFVRPIPAPGANEYHNAVD